MSIKGLLFRFVLLYFSLLIAAMVAGAYVDLDQAGTAIGMGILALAVVWPCESFGRRNGRYLSRAEKWRVIAAMIAVLLGTQIPLTLLVMWAEGIALDAVMLGIGGGRRVVVCRDRGGNGELHGPQPAQARPGRRGKRGVGTLSVSRPGGV